MVHELIYAGQDIEELIKSRWPDAKITDASDHVRTEMFELDIPGVEEDEFYPFAMSRGFIGCCFGFGILRESLRFPESKSQPSKKEETLEKIEKWIELSIGLLKEAHNDTTIR